MESMRRNWCIAAGVMLTAWLLSLAQAQRPPIAWMGGGEINTGFGYYFQNEQYFVTDTGFELHFWRHEDNRLARTLSYIQLVGHYGGRIAVIPNSNRLVAATVVRDANYHYILRVRIWQPSDSGLIHWTQVAYGEFSADQEGGTPPDVEPGGVRALAVSPDGQYIAVGGGDTVFERAGFVLLRVNGNQIQRVQFLGRDPNWAPIFSAAFSPDGEWLFGGSTGGWVFVYKHQADGTYTYHQRFIIGGNGYYINCFAFTYRPDGKYVAVGVMPNGIIEIRRLSPTFGDWRLYLQWHTPSRSAPTSSVNDLAFSPDGNHLFAAYGIVVFGVIYYDPYLRVYQINYSSDPDYRNAQVVHEVLSEADPVSMVELNSAGTEFYTGTVFGNLRRWDMELNDMGIPNHRGWIRALAWSPDGSKIATSADPNYVVPTQTFIWNFASQSMQARIDHFGTSWIGALAFSPDGNYLATVGRMLPERIIEIWDANTGEFVVSVGTLSYNGGGLAFSPDGRYLYAASRDGDLRAFERGADWYTWWQVAQATAPNNGQSPLQIALSPSGDFLAVGSQQKVQIYATPSLTLVREITVASAPERVISVAWSPDGRYIAAGVREVRPAPVYLISTADWSVRRLPTAPNGFDIYAVSFTPDGCYVLGSGSQNDDGSGSNLMIWHTGAGGLVAEYDDETTWSVDAAAFSPDGRYIAYGRSDGTLVVAENPFYRRAGDVDRNGCVDDADLLIVLFNFGGTDPNADLNCDGIVDDADLLIVLFNFGSGC